MTVARVSTLSLLASADALLVARTSMPRVRTPVMADDAPNFYTVTHTFNGADAAEEWWKAVAETDMAADAKKQHEEGIFAHNFLPAGPDGPIFCLWECKEDVKQDAFQTFIDDFTGPAMNNEPKKVIPGAITPTSAWPAMPSIASKKESSGSFFWVYHQFKEGAAQSFFTTMADVDPAEFEKANRAKGVHNHYFLPTGTTDEDPAICVWETKVPMTVAEFEEFINGEDFMYSNLFKNNVFPVWDVGVVPSAAFPKSWLDETMASIEAMMAEGGLKIESFVESFKKVGK